MDLCTMRQGPDCSEFEQVLVFKWLGRIFWQWAADFAGLWLKPSWQHFAAGDEELVDPPVFCGFDDLADVLADPVTAEEILGCRPVIAGLVRQMSLYNCPGPVS